MLGENMAFYYLLHWTIISFLVQLILSQRDTYSTNFTPGPREESRDLDKQDSDNVKNTTEDCSVAYHKNPKTENCWFIERRPMSWTEAKASCNKSNGTLGYVYYKSDEEFILEHLDVRNGSPVEGEMSHDTFWVSRCKENTCRNAWYQKRLHLKYEDCMKKQKSLCMKESPHASKAVEPSCQDISECCPVSYREDPATHKWWLIERELMNWTDAKASCEKNNGVLGNLITQSDKNFILKHLDPQNGTHGQVNSIHATFWVSKATSKRTECPSVRYENEWSWKAENCSKKQKSLCLKVAASSGDISIDSGEQDCQDAKCQKEPTHTLNAAEPPCTETSVECNPCQNDGSYCCIDSRCNCSCGKGYDSKWCALDEEPDPECSGSMEISKERNETTNISLSSEHMFCTWTISLSQLKVPLYITRCPEMAYVYLKNDENWRRKIIRADETKSWRFPQQGFAVHGTYYWDQGFHNLRIGLQQTPEATTPTADIANETTITTDNDESTSYKEQTTIPESAQSVTGATANLTDIENGETTPLTHPDITTSHEETTVQLPAESAAGRTTTMHTENEETKRPTPPDDVIFHTATKTISEPTQSATETTENRETTPLTNPDETTSHEETTAIQEPVQSGLTEPTTAPACPMGQREFFVERPIQPGNTDKQKKCVKTEVSDLHDELRTMSKSQRGDNIGKIAEKMREFTTLWNLSADDCDVIFDSIDIMTDIMIQRATPNDHRYVAQEIFAAVSNLLNEEHVPKWANTTTSKSGEKMLASIEKTVKSLQPLHRGIFCVNEDNLVIQMTEGIEKSEVQFPQEESTQNCTVPDWIQSAVGNLKISNESLKHIPDRNQLSFGAAFFKNVQEVMPSLVSESGKDRHRVNSAIMALVVDPPNEHKYSPPIIITHRHLKEGYHQPICSFWDFNSGNGTEGGWSSDGCRVNVAKSSEKETVCECDHLTNFAILMTPIDVEVSALHTKYLGIISTVGCILSIIGLTATLLVYFLTWKYIRKIKAQKDKALILINLSVALLMVYGIFLAGVKTQNKKVCTLVAVSLHYFCLVVFFTMLAEGMELWRMCWSVMFVSASKPSTIRYMVMGWGGPVPIIVISVIATRLTGYGTENYCWLSSENGLTWAFVGPVLVIIAVNIIVMGLAMRMIYSAKEMLQQSKKEMAKVAVKNLCFLLPLTGITWLLGVFAVTADLVVFQYLFAICNSLQLNSRTEQCHCHHSAPEFNRTDNSNILGFLIFVFYCASNERVKKAFRRQKKKVKNQEAKMFDMTPVHDERHTSGQESETCQTHLSERV